MPLPTELEIIAKRMISNAAQCTEDARVLSMGPLGYKPSPEQAQAMRDMSVEVLQVARALEFDAKRVEDLAEEQADLLRHLYRMSMEGVDALRTSQVMDVQALLLELFANMQQAIAPVFPGEKIPSGN